MPNIAMAQAVEGDAPTSPSQDAPVSAVAPELGPFVLPMIDPPVPLGNGQLSEDAQRKIVGAALLATSVPMLVLGLRRLNSEARWVAGRNLTAREAGAALFGGALNAGQGAMMLLADGPEARRRAHIKLEAEDYRDPLIPLLHAEAADAAKTRKETGVLIGVGGAVAGAVIAFLPVSDAKVDRRILIGAGLGVMAAGVGAGVYTYNTDPPEMELFKAALERQSLLQKRPRRRK